ncbi:uncharacterized protein LOC132604159 isoform X1 [Lycium barbarum]|uniref:uncharacterized protein LOC132604159 isoform X1 n=1 Tax=Lycium barbarum TaxID=112863 RepID=UPI00293F3E30|nr:uncharacterized protein LOC132604159 isoform X1 [Lycium barbarum]
MFEDPSCSLSCCTGHISCPYKLNLLFWCCKLQRDKERVKSERKKEKKREKKERKREKQEKAKQESSCSRNGKLISGGDNRELKTSYLQKDLENATERLEISSLSEEHGQPVCSEDPSHSSDSTGNNNKRKRPTSPSNGIHGHGTTVPIRLSSQKHGECDISTKEDCFTKSAKHEAEVSIRASAERVFPLSNNNNQLSPRISVSKQCTSSSRGTEPIAKDKKTTASCSKLHETDLELEFKNLITNCVPPSLDYDFDDQDWLFQRKDKRMRVKEKGEDINMMSCGTSALLPRAQYLDDAELYAFPFTVPF